MLEESNVITADSKVFGSFDEGKEIPKAKQTTAQSITSIIEKEYSDAEFKQLQSLYDS